MTPETLRRKRQEIKLSQIRLGRLASVSRFRIVMYELGDGTLKHDEVLRIEAAIKAYIEGFRDIKIEDWDQPQQENR